MTVIGIMASMRHLELNTVMTVMDQVQRGVMLNTPFLHLEIMNDLWLSKMHNIKQVEQKITTIMTVKQMDLPKQVMNHLDSLETLVKFCHQGGSKDQNQSHFRSLIMLVLTFDQDRQRTEVVHVLLQFTPRHLCLVHTVSSVTLPGR